MNHDFEVYFIEANSQSMFGRFKMKEITVEGTPCPVCNNSVNILKQEIIATADNQPSGLFRCARGHRFNLNSQLQLRCVGLPTTEDQIIKTKFFSYDGEKWIAQ